MYLHFSFPFYAHYFNDHLFFLYFFCCYHYNYCTATSASTNTILLLTTTIIITAVLLLLLLLLILTDFYIPHLHSILLLLQSVIVRLRTGLQAGAEKNVAAAFALWRSATTHYTVYRRTTLTSYFTQVQYVCM